MIVLVTWDAFLAYCRTNHVTLGDIWRLPPLLRVSLIFRTTLYNGPDKNGYLHDADYFAMESGRVTWGHIQDLVANFETLLEVL